MGLRDLLAFLTTLPAGGGSLEGAASSFYAAPAVGLIVGSIVAAAAWAASYRPALGPAVVVALHALLTGTLNLDGLMDYFDVVGSGLRGQEALRVLKDPRKGAFAVAAAVVVLALRASAAYYLLRRPAVMVASYVAAYEGGYLAAAVGREEPYEGLARRFSEESRRAPSIAKNLALTAAICAALALLSGPRSLLPLLALAAPYALVADAERRLGFVNGDVIGASIELAGAIAMVVGALA